MLPREAQWFGKQLARIPVAELYPLCNVGSATRAFREETQPWIDRELFAPARAALRRVVHVDMTQAEGVDMAGDLNEPAFIAKLAGQGFRSVLCANLLEHVADPIRIAQDLLRILPAGGYLLISVPYRFPYHPDPIDTMFRPDPTQLSALFPGTRVMVSEVVAGGTMLGYVLGRAMRPRALWRSLRGAGPESIVEPPSPAQRASPWRYVPWLVRQFEVSCVVLRKE